MAAPSCKISGSLSSGMVWPDANRLTSSEPSKLNITSLSLPNRPRKMGARVEGCRPGGGLSSSADERCNLLWLALAAA